MCLVLGGWLDGPGAEDANHRRRRREGADLHTEAEEMKKKKGWWPHLPPPVGPAFSALSQRTDPSTHKDP